MRKICKRDWAICGKLYRNRSWVEKKAYWLFPECMKKRSNSNTPVPFEDQTRFPDFLFREEKIIIEIDGKRHYEGDQPEEDRERDELFKNDGFIVIRIPASLVNTPLDYWFRLFCELAKIERTANRESLEEFINALDQKIEGYWLSRAGTYYSTP